MYKSAWGGSLGNPGHSLDGPCVSRLRRGEGGTARTRKTLGNDEEPSATHSSHSCMPCEWQPKCCQRGALSNFWVQKEVRRDRGRQETRGNATQRNAHWGRKWSLKGFSLRRGEAERLEEGGREGEKKEQKVAVSCTWLETTHLRYTWAPFWALRAHYGKTEQNTETITHRDTNTRSSKNLTLGRSEPPAVNVYMCKQRLFFICPADRLLPDRGRVVAWFT